MIMGNACAPDFIAEIPEGISKQSGNYCSDVLVPARMLHELSGYPSNVFQRCVHDSLKHH